MARYCLNDVLQISNVSSSSDTLLLRKLLEQLRHRTHTVFDCQNAGTVVRFLMPLLCITPGTWILTGDERLCQRPMKPLVDALQGMGFCIESTKTQGFLPVSINGGQPRRKMVFIDPTMSSQFVSGLLLMGPCLEEGLTLTLTSRPSSRPYISMTCDVLRQLGVPMRFEKSNKVIATGCYTDSKPTKRLIQIERDWSAASYFYMAALLLPGKRIRLTGLTKISSQGDAVVANLFEKLGVDTIEVRSPYGRGNSLRVECCREPQKRIDVSMRNNPDLVPTLVVACAAIGVSCRLRGVESLRYKECDRLAALETELKSMGADITVGQDCITLRRSVLQPTRPVHTYNDHRIAMAFAPLKFRFPDLEIENPEVVVKSFPDFWTQLARLQNAD